MLEVSDSGKDHRNIMLVGRFDYFFVPNRTARLNYGGHARARGLVHPITKREKGIGSKHASRYR
jgi:hypothetical protein